MCLALLVLSACTPTDSRQKEPVSDNPVKESASYAVEDVDLVYTFTVDDKTLTLDFWQYGGEYGWMLFNSIAVGRIDGQTTITFENCIPGERPFVKDASGLSIPYTLEGGLQNKLIVDIDKKSDDEVKTFYYSFFDDVELVCDQDAVLGYIVISDDRADLSSWTAADFEEGSNIADGWQVIRISAVTEV